ncbi:hypothetical protein EW146_g3268 [Bondarzewia mesenterica]|uniref:Uncharacterized protein n=1 Tax=Bondarzewia mesenterica TaxID=1095465 RepID=A0A4S4LY47_9AGAM|nr:hypothetical protein EW146_g3268 [Bondarzewia mesenterica]
MAYPAKRSGVLWGSGLLVSAKHLCQWPLSEVATGMTRYKANSPSSFQDRSALLYIRKPAFRSTPDGAIKITPIFFFKTRHHRRVLWLELTAGKGGFCAQGVDEKMADVNLQSSGQFPVPEANGWIQEGVDERVEKRCLLGNRIRVLVAGRGGTRDTERLVFRTSKEKKD